MHIDYALILTVLTLITGVFWGIHRWYRKREREEQLAKPIEFFGSLFPVLLIVLVFRSFLFEPFKIPSGSMIPTLWIGDFIVVNKFAYDLRLPVLNTKIVETGDPERGDIAVFRYPRDERVNYIKRVVGLPGDTVTYRNKTLYINGDPIVQEVNGDWEGVGLNRNPPGTDPVIHHEYLEEEPHRMVVYPRARASESRTWTVPEGHYFVMGDNRDRSQDSRKWGFVPDENLLGKAVRIWMHWDCSRGCVDWSRIGDKIE